ncbi:MAG TPA: hypothetical protein VIW24_03240 [Aldersonia sp.]
MPQVFHALVIMNLLFVSGAWCLARPSRLAAATVLVVSVLWVLFNGPIEGNVLLVLSPGRHGITESDLLAVIGVGIGARALILSGRRAKVG